MQDTLFGLAMIQDSGRDCGIKTAFAYTVKDPGILDCAVYVIVAVRNSGTGAEGLAPS